VISEGKDVRLGEGGEIGGTGEIAGHFLAFDQKESAVGTADYWLRDWAQRGFDWSLLLSALSYRSDWFSRWLICAESAAAKMTSVEAIKLKTR